MRTFTLMRELPKGSSGRIWRAAWIVCLCMGVLWALHGCGQEDAASGANQSDSSSAADNGEPTVNSASKPSIKKPSPSPTPFISKADFPEILKKGRIRLIAPALDHDEGLPSAHLSVSAFREIAEEFASVHQLEFDWHYVDNFESLIPALENGHGDIIVANLTATKSRKKSVAFSRELSRVSEWVISKKTLQLNDKEDLGKVKIAIPKGTSYEETLVNQKLEKSIEFLPSQLPLFDVLRGVEDGLYDATISDDALAKPLLKEFSTLDVDFTIKKKQKIAWAVRKNNKELLKALNEFLVSHHITQSRNKEEKRNWEAIKKRGTIRMLTLNNPASYFMWRGEIMGFDFDLMKRFAKENKLHLSVVVKDDIQSLFEALKKGEGDVVAASITRTAQRAEKDLLFTHRYLYVDQKILRSAKNSAIAEENLHRYTIGLNPDTSFYSKVKALYPEDFHKNILIFEGESTESLITKMANGDFDLSVADSHLVALEKTYHDNLEVVKTLEEKTPISWVLRSDQKSLHAALNAFIKKEYRGVFYNVTFKKYFRNKKKIRKYQDGRITDSDSLSPYDDIVKKIADEAQLDWRLIIAQMYQESKFNPKARSFAGARGLMQIMPKTAKELGVTNVESPEQGIKAGIAYLQWLEKRFPEKLDVQGRLYFSLAAYNAGVGHVRDARSLARKLGLDPNQWFNHVEVAMLKLSDPKYYKQSRFGYVRGSEPVEYVRKIRERYLGYLAQK